MYRNIRSEQNSKTKLLSGLILDAHLKISVGAPITETWGGADIVPIPVETELNTRDFNTTEVNCSEILVHPME